MDSKRQKIVNALIASLQQIKVANGYQTDLGNDVRDWETNFEEEELPVLSVCDLVSEEDQTQPDSARQFSNLPVMLRVFADRKTTGQVLRKYLADISKAINTNRRLETNGVGLALFTVPERHGIIHKPETFEVSGCAVEITVRYSTKTFNLYE